VTLHDSRLLLETFHFLLHAQCGALLSAFHLTPHLVSTVGRLWLNYVQWWQHEGWGRDEDSMVVFKVAPGIKVGQMKQKVKAEERQWQQAKADTSAAGMEESNAEAYEQHRAGEEDSENAAEVAAASSARPLDVGELSLPLSLAFLYVALQSCRCPITMHQLVSLARINRLPYLNFIQPSTLPPRLHSLLTTSPSVRSFYRPSILPATPTLLQLAHHVCAVLGLVSPAPAGKQRREASVRATFGLHDEWFHAVGCVRSYMRQLHVPEVLYGLCVAMTRVWTAVMEEKWRTRRNRGKRKRATERKYDGREEDEEAGTEEKDEEEQGPGGGAGAMSGGHDDWSVMVCIVTVLKLVYGLDRVADTENQQGKDEKQAEEENGDTEEKGEQAEDRDEQEEEVEEGEEQASEEDGAGWASEGPTEQQRAVHIAERWQTEAEEMEEYRQLQQLYREEEAERQRQQQTEAALHDNCATLLQMLADDHSAPPSTSLDADLVRLLNPSTHFPSSLYEARHMRADQQADMLRLWDDAILPPSLAIDDYGEYLDKMRTLHPPLDTDPASKPSLASLWRHLSTHLAHPHHATYRQYSRSRQYASQPLHADYSLVVHCGALLCGLSAASLERRVWRWGQQLWRWMGRKRYHSVGWKKYEKELKARKERLRRKRKREPGTGTAERQAEEAGEEYQQDEVDEEEQQQDEELQAGDEVEQREEQEQQDEGQDEQLQDEEGSDDASHSGDIASLDEEDEA